MPKVHFMGRVLECAVGATLRDVLRDADLPVYNGRARHINCRGLGTCGTCAVAIEGAVAAPGVVESWRLDFPPHRADAGLRLACQIAVENDLVIEKYPGFWGHLIDEPALTPGEIVSHEHNVSMDEMMSVPKKYDSIDFQPPAKVASRAERGLELRREFERGGTQVGVARARDLKNRRNLSPETIERMVSYFARHEVDKDADGFGDEDEPTAGYIAWLLWGGDEGRRWAESIKEQMEEADEAAG